MTTATASLENLQLVDLHPAESDIRSEVLQGISASPPSLPCKLFYDEVGSALFEEICQLDEYYPTRTEIAILIESATEICSVIGSEAILLEYGSGSAQKTEPILERMIQPAAYVSIELSLSALTESSGRIAADFPRLPVIAICADYTRQIDLPADLPPHSRKVAFFPGSTIGNFAPDESIAFLSRIRETVGESGGLVLGTDLKKDPAILVRAYDDQAGVTAEFNRNILRRLNRDLGCDFDLDAFDHLALYNAELGRIEMYLVNQESQQVSVGGRTIHLAKGQRIHTENAWKYSIDDVHELANRSGFELRQTWTDPDELFAVHYLSAAA